MRKHWLIGVLAVAVVVAAAGGLSTWRAVGQQESPINFAPEITPTGLVSINGEALSGALVAIYEANGMSHAEALDTAIEQVLMHQAARRLGLESTEEEAVKLLRSIEASWADASDEGRQEIDAIMFAQGLPTSNLADNPVMLLYGRAAATTGNMRNYLLERLAVAQLTGVAPDDISGPQELAAARQGISDQTLGDVYNQIIFFEQRLEPEVARFVQQERSNADIVLVAE